MGYEFNTTVAGTFDEAVETVRMALLEEQLGIVSEVDVQAIFKQKMGKDMPPYKIFGACNPKIAAHILEVEPTAGTLLPCNFVMYEATGGNVVVSFMDPVTILNLAESEQAHQAGEIAKDKLLRVLNKLANNA